jgi:3-hydroxyethyl bacteriochlorophyllide a dehydrogenase
LGALSDIQGVLLALAATALHGNDVGGVAAGQRVLVLGQGVVGQLAARFAKMRGAHVTVVDPSAIRLRLSVADAAHEALPPAPPGPPGSGPAFDLLIDASGKMEAIAPALMRIRKGGALVLLGYYDAIQLPYQPVFLNELRLLASAQWAPGDLVRARDAIASGAVDVAPLLTHTMPAAAAREAYDVAFEDERCIKMMLEWSQHG